ncbi:hypothetical protein [Bradyrhizobium sp.]|uniref:hypothetical protein n=1 Tax=Bradyrhizobium sp. TaxID=376 RepID=UPI0025C1F39E|nr:hypothetical protein [Bradyrhizobium sp.]
MIDEATLLVRVRVPPETWTTKLEPLGQPEPEVVDHLFDLVIIFSNECSKFQHCAKENDHFRLWIVPRDTPDISGSAAANAIDLPGLLAEAARQSGNLISTSSPRND